MLKQTISKVPKILLAGALTASTGVVVSIDSVIDKTNVQYAYAESALANNNPTQEEIKQAFKNANVERYLPLTYDVEPSLSVPYSAGKLSQATLSNVLNYLNLVRFVAGSNPVTLDSNLEQEAQAAALIQTINGDALTHNPARPANVDDSLWALASEGSKGNIDGHRLSTTAIDDLVDDLSSSTMGHRNSILGGSVEYVGFGSTNDRSVVKMKSNLDDYSYQQLAWPANNMPTELYNPKMLWSYISNQIVTQEMDANKVFVFVTNLKTNETQSLTGSDLYVSQWGSNVVFKPSFTPQAGDSYSVMIDGLEEGTVSYTVNFFNATDVSEPSNQNTSNNTTPPTDKPASELNASWAKSGSSWWYRYGDGTYPANKWEKINGTWYHFDSVGWMQTGWQYIGGKWYYLNPSGAMLTGWQYIGGKWYYLNPAGDMSIGWKQVGGSWYYLNSSGAMQTGWLKQGNSWYYLNNSGAMLTGWYKVGSSWYYSNASGVMQSNKWIGNYYVSASGAMATNTWIGNYHVNGSGLWDKTA